MNKHEVLVLDGTFFVPTEDALNCYDLINKVMAATKTCCRQTPGEYEFSQMNGFIRYQEKEHFEVDKQKVIDILKKNGYNECINNDTDLPVVRVLLKNT